MTTSTLHRHPRAVQAGALVAFVFGLAGPLAGWAASSAVEDRRLRGCQRPGAAARTTP